MRIKHKPSTPKYVKARPKAKNFLNILNYENSETLQKLWGFKTGSAPAFLNYGHHLILKWNVNIDGRMVTFSNILKNFVSARFSSITTTLLTSQSFNLTSLI